MNMGLNYKNFSNNRYNTKKCQVDKADVFTLPLPVSYPTARHTAHGRRAGRPATHGGRPRAAQITDTWRGVRGMMGVSYPTDIPHTADRHGDRPRTATQRPRAAQITGTGAGRVRRQGDDDDLLRTHVTSGGELARTDEKTKITTLR